MNDINLEYLGFIGQSFKMDDDGTVYVEAHDMDDQVIVASGSNIKELEQNFRKVIDDLLDC